MGENRLGHVVLKSGTLWTGFGENYDTSNHCGWCVQLLKLMAVGVRTLQALGKKSSYQLRRSDSIRHDRMSLNVTTPFMWSSFLFIKNTHTTNQKNKQKNKQTKQTNTKKSKKKQQQLIADLGVTRANERFRPKSSPSSPSSAPRAAAPAQVRWG